MEILETNFNEKLPEILEVIEKADFIGIDLEFTGLNQTSTFSHPFASVASFYNRIQKTFEGFIVIQLGITAFWVHPDDEKKFQCKSFNIYLYPRGRKSVFRFEGSCLDFLAGNGFDFNKLFTKGVTYCSVHDAEKLKGQLAKKHKEKRKQLISKEPDVSSHIQVPEQEQEVVNKACEEIDKFLESADQEEVVFDSYNGFQRKLIYQTIEGKYFTQVSASPKDLERNRKGIVITRKKTLDEEIKLFEEKCQEEIKKLETEIGVTHIFQALSKSRKLLVCHNMFLDLIYLMRQFTGPLPEDLDEFKKLVHDFFPNVLDTKHLCTKGVLKEVVGSSVLPHVLEACRSSLFQLPEIESLGDQKYTLDDSKEHEAGYDSFITGVCFLALTNHLGILPKDLNANCKKLKSFKNKIFVLGLDNITCCNLTGPDEKPSREHVFHVTFPSTWKNTDIIQHFKNFGPIQIKWINETSAYVALQQREYSQSVMKSIGRYPGVTVVPYAEYEDAQSPHEDRKRKLPESSSQESGEKAVKKAKTTTSKIFPENSDW
ncbi:PARN [Sergentomyia squamirostris]